ncbi:MAG TPA: acyltransferase [Bacteroidia bacterium]
MHKNNFDFLRHLFAMCVVVAHCFPLSGNGYCDWMCQATGEQFDLSQFGVKGFFIISGYLIFQSLERSQSLFDYYWKRVLRLFPGLVVMLVLTVCFLPFVYTGTLREYITNKSTLTYLPYNLILYKTQYVIPGVFENNPYKSIINGSLWTIAYEFTMYMLLSLLFFFKTNRPLVKIVLAGSVILFLVINLFFADRLKGLNFILMSNHFVDLGFYFIIGSAFSVFKLSELRHLTIVLWLAAIITVLASITGYFAYVKYFTLPVLVIGIGTKHTPVIGNLFEKTGDLSYGIYIYGFLVQQILMHYFHLGFVGLLVGSLIVIPLLALFSWHVIEKKALSYKDFFKKRKMPGIGA